jgi:hypothetical protein
MLARIGAQIQVLVLTLLSVFPFTAQAPAYLLGGSQVSLLCPPLNSPRIPGAWV